MRRSSPEQGELSNPEPDDELYWVNDLAEWRVRASPSPDCLIGLQADQWSLLPPCEGGGGDCLKGSL